MLPLLDETGHQTWFSENSGSDVAAVPFSAIQGSFPPPPDRLIQTIGINEFGNADDTYEGESIFLYGFPGLVDAQHLTIPITRQGIVAWTDPNGPNNNRFLIDAAIFPGNSGGPVFKVPAGLARDGGFQVGGHVALLGIVVATYNAAFSADHPDVRVTGLGNLGIVEPVAHIMDLLKQMHADFDLPRTK